jgi:exonuclease VII large subunit
MSSNTSTTDPVDCDCDAISESPPSKHTANNNSVDDGMKNSTTLLRKKEEVTDAERRMIMESFQQQLALKEQQVKDLERGLEAQVTMVMVMELAKLD